MDTLFADSETSTPAENSPSTVTFADMASPPPEALPQNGSNGEAEKDASSLMLPYASMGQLSYAPATQTTVVTTTTTTTTSFPPLVFKPPRHLTERDPKHYPLAALKTPEALQNFSFSLNGQPVFFREVGSPERTFEELNEQYATLKASNGTVHKVTQSDVHFETPHRLQSSSALPTISRSTSSHITRKRAPSPVSLAEAAELASLQRRSKRFRASAQEADMEESEGTLNDGLQMHAVLEQNTPATPDTEAGQLGQFKIPKTRAQSRRPSLRQLARQRSGTQNLYEAAVSWADQHRGHNDKSSQSSTVSGESSRLRHTSGPATFSRALIAGVAATPPIAESDLEPILPTDTHNENTLRANRPRPLDTVSLQDASLPSPSLSPITAAANLAHAASGRGPMDDEDDANDVSSLDISQEGRDFRTSRRRQAAAPSRKLELPTGNDVLTESSPNPQLPTPTMMDVPNMLDSFDAMPDEMKTYVMYQFLRRCAKPTLHFVADVVNPALKCDFLANLPYELSLNIVKYLDAKSMCRAAQVSRKWRQIVDSDEKTWKELVDEAGFEVPDWELERAIRQGWGWQFPSEPINWERDLSSAAASKQEADSPPRSSASSTVAVGDCELASAPITSSRKRKSTSRTFGAHKKQRRKGATSSKTQAISWSRSFGTRQRPNAYANAAALAVPDPGVGLPSLRQLHLFKSIYQRHHLIRKCWMAPETVPHHLAFKAHQNHVVTCLQIDTDKILTGSDDTSIHVYDARTGAIRRKLIGHEGGVWALQYDGNTLVSGSTDRSVRVWDIEKGRCLQVFQGHTSTVRCLVILKPTEIGQEDDGTPIMMPKEPLIITGSRDSTLRVWKLPQPGDRSIFQTGPAANDFSNPYFIRSLSGHHHSVRAIAAHGDTLVSGSYDNSVRVWKISTGENQHRLNGHTQKVYSVVLDHERNRCISGSMDYMVKVWSLDSGQCLFSLEGHTSLVGLLDLSHGRLVSAAADSTLRIWDPENGHCKSTLTAHTGAITCFQHDGQKVISGSDRTLKMWDVRTGECVRDLLTDLSGVWQVKFNERRCVAAVQRSNWTYIEVLDFGAARDGVPKDKLGVRVVVGEDGRPTDDTDEEEAGAAA